MKLRELLSVIDEREPSVDVEITGLCLDSKQVTPGCVFFAIRGHQQNGHAYIQEAITRGASAVLYEPGYQSGKNFDFSHQSRLHPVQNLQDKVGIMASAFYGDTASKLQMIGVTGTNGKTTTTYLLSQAMSRIGNLCGIVGTLGYGLNANTLQKTGLTTPNAVDLHAYLHALSQEGAQAVACEVSSHALSQGRVEGVVFESAIFTNLSQDHLDYHGTMEAYGQQKLKLFQKPRLRRAILNADDPFTKVILQKIRRDIPVVLYSINPNIKEQFVVHRPFISWVIAKHYQLNQSGVKATLYTPWGEGVLQTPLLGAFNLSNALAVLSELCMQGVTLSTAINALKQVSAAPGRMQRFGGIHTPQVIVDYAHTPEALKEALESARQHCKRRLWCVFGCGGDRDVGKRGQMGRVAAALADRIVITNDNPRTENPRQIIADILHGLQVDDGYKVVIEEDRKKAIEHAINHALPVDTILVAGKGHEDTQTIGDTQYPFSDIQWVKLLTGAKQSA